MKKLLSTIVLFSFLSFPLTFAQDLSMEDISDEDLEAIFTDLESLDSDLVAEETSEEVLPETPASSTVSVGEPEDSKDSSEEEFLKAAPQQNDTVVTFGVKNISRSNQDASRVSARPGDILRYEVRLKSTTTDVEDFVASYNIADVLATSEIIDSGLGTVRGNVITFPSFSQKAPCEKVFTFVARVKDCAGKEKMRVGAYGSNYDLPLECPKKVLKQLPASGSSQTMGFLLGILSAVLLLGFLWKSAVRS